MTTKELLSIKECLEDWIRTTGEVNQRDHGKAALQLIETELQNLLTSREARVRDMEDAMRYRWLRKQHWENNTIGVVCLPKDSVKLGRFVPSEKLLDSLVDSLMAGESVHQWVTSNFLHTQGDSNLS